MLLKGFTSVDRPRFPEKCPSVVRQLSQRCLVEFARHDHEGRKLLLRRCQHLLDISQFGFGLLQVFSQLFDLGNTQFA